MTITGAEVRSRREALGWTQDMLASASGLGRRTIQNIEAGKTKPTAETLRCLSAALDIRKTSDDRKEQDTNDVTVENLLAYWVEPADPAPRVTCWNDPVYIGPTFFVSVVVAFIVGLTTEHGSILPKIVYVSALFAGFLFFLAAWQHARLRTESDVDQDRAMFRERLLRDGIDAWRIPDQVTGS
jgi:transcriptional regulator with XRE-family HTH domain